MSLRLLQADGLPWGQFDVLDAQASTLKGGEVMTFATVVVSVDNAAADVEVDGYVNPNTRVVATNTLTSGTRPLLLADEGIAGYGTLLGSVVGGTAGRDSVGTVVGPHTTSGSGKVTLWTKGLFEVSLDACDTNATTGLTPTNPTLTTGAPLYATAAGLLTPRAAGAFAAVVVGRFVEFTTNESLVTTPRHLTGNSASKTLTFAKFYFNPPVA